MGSRPLTGSPVFNPMAARACASSTPAPTPPLAIAEEWNDLVVTLETATTLVPVDPESEQLVAMTAYASEPSAFAVKKWLSQNCGVEIPITTIAPQEQIPARTTTTTIGPTATTVDEG